MAPSLQALWEAQDRLGLETDEATQALIDQAVEQGIVGVHMKDTNEQILAVLLAIAEVFDARIPAGLEATSTKSRRRPITYVKDFNDAGQKAKDAMKIDVPPVQVDFEYNLPDPPTFDFGGRFTLDDVPHLGTGGIVRRPTLALVGESGPEIVAPLGTYFAAPRSDTTTILEIDGRAFAEVVAPYLPGEVTRIGVGLT